MRKLNFTLASLLLIVVAFVSCKKTDTTTTTSSNYVPPANAIKGDTLANSSTYQSPSGYQSIKGTMEQNKAYYLNGNVYVPNGDTLIIQQGASLTALGNYIITVRGVLITQGTSSAPITLSVPNSVKSSTNGGYGGAWGGINADSAQNLTLKWTKVEYVGGPNAAGKARLGISCEYTQVLDMEDSWLRFTYDDGL